MPQEPQGEAANKQEAQVEAAAQSTNGQGENAIASSEIGQRQHASNAVEVTGGQHPAPLPEQQQQQQQQQPQQPQDPVDNTSQSPLPQLKA